MAPLVLLSLPMSNGTVCRKEKEKGWVGGSSVLCFFARVDWGTGEPKGEKGKLQSGPRKEESEAKQVRSFLLNGCFTLNFLMPKPIFYLSRAFIPFFLKNLLESRQFQLKSHPSRLTSLNNKPFCRKGAYRFFLR